MPEETGEGLKSVNWTTGMLLTPEHFKLQDRYIDNTVGWVLRNCMTASGLVGGGVRLEAAERGLGVHDPKVDVQDDGTTVSISVRQARGLTSRGDIVDIDEHSIIRQNFGRGDLAGATELLVYLVAGTGKEEDPESVGSDDANPNFAALRRNKYTIALGVDADALPHSLAIGKVRRASETLGFELDPRFIPSCATLMAHSSLYTGWRSLQAEIVLLAGEFAELHRAVARYADQVSRRGIDVRADTDILAFIERAVMALDTVAYETFDPAMSPFAFFQQVDRCGRRIAVALDLSASTQSFFQTLTGADASYATLLEEERQALSTRRELNPRDDLRHSLERAEQTIGQLRRLSEALEGKYIDYRINRSIDSLRFLLDRGGEHFYVSVATPGHPQRDGDILTFVFSQMNLTGRHEYRIVLMGDPQGTSSWQVGEELRVDLRINSTAGPSRPTSRNIAAEIPGQRNFAMNFDTPPDVATISGLTITVQPGHRVRGALLYQRRLGLIAEGSAPPPPMSSPAPSVSPVAPVAPPPMAPRPSEPTPTGTPVIKLKKPK
jgi:hypothetical protein